MDYYDISVQCTMISLGGNDTAEWAKREDVEAMIAERDALRAELARVKSENLRVVIVPDKGNLYDWYMTPTGLGYPGKDRKQKNCIESAKGYYRLDECKPVRIERWEDE